MGNSLQDMLAAKAAAQTTTPTNADTVQAKATVTPEPVAIVTPVVGEKGYYHCGVESCSNPMATPQDMLVCTNTDCPQVGVKFKSVTTLTVV